MANPSAKQDWSIVLFCYNEEKSLSSVLQRLRKVLAQLSSRWEILIIDDGSTDSSPSLIREAARGDRRIRAHFHPKNLGIGRTLRDGYRLARFQNVCAVPADGQFDPSELLSFPRVSEGSFVSFFRRTQSGYSLYRRLLSAGNRFLNEVLLGFNLEDVNWVKVYKRKDLAALDLRLESSLVESEICAKLILKGRSFTQCPSTYHRRVGGRAKGGGWKTLIQALREIIRLAMVIRAYRKTLGLPGRF